MSVVVEEMSIQAHAIASLDWRAASIAEGLHAAIVEANADLPQVIVMADASHSPAVVAAPGTRGRDVRGRAGSGRFAHGR